MAIVAALFSGSIGFISFLVALLMLDYSFMSACALYMSVAQISFAWTMCWAFLTFRSNESNIRTA